MKIITFIERTTDEGTEILGCYESSKRALKVLRYLFERKKKYNYIDCTKHQFWDAMLALNKNHPKEYPQWRNAKQRNCFYDITGTYSVIARGVK